MDVLALSCVSDARPRGCAAARIPAHGVAFPWNSDIAIENLKTHRWVGSIGATLADSGPTAAYRLIHQCLRDAWTATGIETVQGTGAVKAGARTPTPAKLGPDWPGPVPPPGG